MVCDAVGAYSFISSRILNLRTSIAYAEKEIEVCEKAVEDFRQDLQAAFSNLKNNCESIRRGGPCSLEFMLIDVIQNMGTRLLGKSEGKT